jgi:putative transposon-encoded protein
MRRIEIVKHKLVLTDEVEVVYEKRVTPFGTSAKVSVPKKHIGKRAYVIILKD